MSYNEDYHQFIIEASTNPFLVIDNQTWSYRSFVRYCLQLSEQFLAQGVTEGQIVAINGPPSVRYLAAAIALLSINATLAPIPVNELLLPQQKWLNSVGCYQMVDLGDLFASEMVKELALLKVHDLKMGSQTVSSIKIDTQKAHTLFRTSGSVGESKNVLHRFSKHLASANAVCRRLNFYQKDRWFLSLPLAHVSGFSILVRALARGASIALSSKNMSLVDSIKRTGATYASMVPVQVIRSFADDASNEILCTLKVLLIGGSATPAHVFSEANRRNINMVASYGSTETASMICSTFLGYEAKSHHVGKALPGVVVKISRDSEIMISSPTMFEGYYKSTGTIDAIDSHGYFKTGDLGFFDDEGCLNIYGRKDNMMVSGGENIFPEEIENVLCGIDGVVEAIVVALKHKEFGHRPCAFVKMADCAVFSVKNLKQELEKKLPRFKVPDNFYLWPKEHAPYGFKTRRCEFAKLALLLQKVLKPKRPKKSEQRVTGCSLPPLRAEKIT